MDQSSIIIAEDITDEHAIEHYGVKGMKWGKWNAETLRKYRGGNGGGRASKAASTMGKKLSGLGGSASALMTRGKNRAMAKVSSMKTQYEAKQQFKKTQKEEAKRNRKELGMSRKEYDKLRESALKSHDPAVVARGMHTLTDAELNSKIDRLSREARISSLATEQAKNKAQARTARNNALTSSPIYKIGEGTAKAMLNEIGMNVIVGKGVSPALTKRVEYYKDVANKKFEAEIAKKETAKLRESTKEAGKGMPKHNKLKNYVTVGNGDNKVDLKVNSMTMKTPSSAGAIKGQQIVDMKNLRNRKVASGTWVRNPDGMR